MDSTENNISLPEDNVTSSVSTRPVKALIIMLGCFSVLGLLGNSLVIYVYAKKRNKLSSTVFIIALAGIDLVTSTIDMPYTMAFEGLNYQLSEDFSCKLYFFFITCTVPFSIFILVAIAIDRYICICRPYSHVLSRSRARKIVFTLLIISSVVGVITALQHGVYVERSILWKHDVRLQTTEVSTNSSLGNVTDFSVQLDAGHCLECVTEQPNEVIQEVNSTVESHENVFQKKRFNSGLCHLNELLFSFIFFNIYQIIYSSLFLICFFVIFVLYILIYRSVLVRRARRFEEKTKTKLSNTSKKSLEQNQTGLIDSPFKNIFMTDISIGCQEISSSSSSPTEEHRQVERKHVQEISSSSSSPTEEHRQVERKHVQEISSSSSSPTEEHRQVERKHVQEISSSSSSPIEEHRQVERKHVQEISSSSSSPTEEHLQVERKHVQEVSSSGSSPTAEHLQVEMKHVQEISSSSSSPTEVRLQVERKHVQEISSSSSSPTEERLQVERKHVQEISSSSSSPTEERLQVEMKHVQEVSSSGSSPTEERLQVERKHVQEISSSSSSPTEEHLQVERKHVQEDDHKLESNDKQKERSQTGAGNGRHREKYYLANIRTAIMLFVVTVVFVITYLPSWLMIFEVIPFNVIIFYVYFSNHIVNPIIYAFMNPAFRRSLQGLLCVKRRRSM